MNLRDRIREFDKPVFGWILYDWANSAFVTTVVAGFFPIFFKTYWSSGVDVNESTYQLGLANSVGSIIVAILSPFLGAIADHGSGKKKFLIFFAYLGALMTFALFFVGKGDWQWAIFIYVLGVIGFSAGNTFYDALLPDVAREDQLELVSGAGFAFGYLGGGLLFLVNVLMTLHPVSFGLADSTAAVKVSFLMVALWWSVFTLFTIFWVREDKSGQTAPPILEQIRISLREMRSVYHKIRQLPNTFLFLLAYFAYIDGVDTIIRMAVDYGLTLGLPQSTLITALLITQFVGFPSAIAYAWLGQRWDVRKAIFLAIAVYTLATLGGAFMSDPLHFYALAIVIGLVQGGIQALSRSYYARLIPQKLSGEFFGFYNMIGKSAVFLGPVLMGIVGVQVKAIFMTDPQIAARWSIASVTIFFFIGAWLLSKVDEKKGQLEAANFEG